MKHLIFYIVAFSLLATSCTQESNNKPETQPELNFEGTYSGSIMCNGEMSEDNGDEFSITITKKDENDLYFIDLGDELIFEGIQKNSIIMIEEQVLNEEENFDVVTFSGEINMITEGSLNFYFSHKVDNEGSSSCDLILERI